MKTFQEFLEEVNLLQEISKELAIKAYIERKNRTAAPITYQQDLATGHTKKQTTKSGQLKYVLSRRRIQDKFGNRINT
jgi:hypothetical protein